MKYIVTLSTGKDSEATLWWAYNNLPFDSWEVVFVDVDWDNQIVYDHLRYLERRVGKKFTTIKSKGFKDKLTTEQIEAIRAIFGGDNVFAEMVLYKNRFPGSKSRFCTVKLKAEPTIDHILDTYREDITIIQGIRNEESEARRNLHEKDEYFKFYFEPYGHDKYKKPKFHTYRKEDVSAHCDTYVVDVFRPIIKWDANRVFNYIFENHSPANLLYKMGRSRVGCDPCVQCRIGEIRLVAEQSPEKIEQIRQLEILSDSTFFPPGFIPSKFCTKVAECMIYREDLLTIFGTKAPKKIKDQSALFQDVEVSRSPEERLYEMYFKNEKIPVYIDEDGDEYIIRKVKVPTIDDVVRYVTKNPNQKDFLPRTGGCVSVYNICDIDPNTLQ